MIEQVSAFFNRLIMRLAAHPGLAVVGGMLSGYRAISIVAVLMNNNFLSMMLSLSSGLGLPFQTSSGLLCNSLFSFDAIGNQGDDFLILRERRV
jgi:hypothetical protein